MLGLVLKSLGRDTEANEYSALGLKRAEAQLRQYPESSRPAQLGACVLAAMGEVERAKKWMDLALEIDPDDRVLLYNAACMWSNLNEPDRALDYLERWANVSAPDLREWIKHDPDMDVMGIPPAVRTPHQGGTNQWRVKATRRGCALAICAVRLVVRTPPVQPSRFESSRSGVMIQTCSRGCLGGVSRVRRLCASIDAASAR